MSAASERLATALADRYHLQRELGQGGMATVYLARDLKHERDVAIKVLKPELGAVLGAERFLKEIRTTANLQHPNLLPLFDSGEADGLLYYVMPFVEGETLRARLDAEQQLSVDETLRLMTLLAGALDYAHARGVVHRDLKPENILLQAGQPVIADFGIALAVAQAGGERITETGLSLGTPHYMSPEQAAGTHTVDARSDQYALGAIAYELLTGEPPHDGATTPIIVARLMTETPRAIRATRPAVAAGVEAAILRALEKAPADRFASCGAFADAMTAGARQGEAALPAPSARRTAVTKAPNRRFVAVAAALVVVAVTVLGIVATRRPEAGADAVPSVSGTNPSEGSTTAAEQSLAVLPFTSVGGDTANAYFAAGIADELSSALTRIPGLRLTGRASAAKVKERGDGAQEIGAALDVGAVLDGSVRRAGDRIRVSAELTSTADGRVLLIETFVRGLEDDFDVQDDITRAIVGALQVRLASGTSVDAAATHGGTTNLAAYDLFLRARQLYRVRNAGLVDAERYLQEAIALDPAYASAHALLASVLLVQPFYLAIRPGDVLGRGRAAAERAVALDDSLALAHVALGLAHLRAAEWPEAERALRRALALDPQVEDAHFRLAETLAQTGRVREALAPLAEATRLDPLYQTPISYTGLALAMLGRVEEARAAMRRALDLDPENLSTNAFYGYVLGYAGATDDAIAHARALVRRTDQPLRVGAAAWMLAYSGQRDEALSLQRRVEALPRGTPGRATGLMYVRVGLQDVAGALDALEEAAAEEPLIVLATLLNNLPWDPLRAEPRFAAVLRRLNLDVARLTRPDGGRSM